MQALPLLVVVVSAVAVVSSLDEEWPLPIVPSLVVFAQIAVVIVVADLVECFLVVPVVPLVHVVLAVLLIRTLVLLRPETDVALILQWRRQVDRGKRGVEGLRLR